jgi:hypothetical protein
MPDTASIIKPTPQNSQETLCRTIEQKLNILGHLKNYSMDTQELTEARKKLEQSLATDILALTGETK